MTKNAACPFCNPSVYKITFLESDRFLAIYNIAPILPGHSLIIPRAHVTSIMELSDSELFEFIRFSRRAISVLAHAFQTESFNWTLQEKEEAGQTILHMHIHIIPRKPEDLPEPGDWYPKLQDNIDNILDSRSRSRLSGPELQSILKKLRDAASEIS